MEKIKIGKIVNAVGLKGEVKVYNYSDSIDIYETAGSLYVGERKADIESVRPHKNTVILKLSVISDRNSAEAVKGEDVFITENDLPKLPEGQYYVRDIIGMEVGDELGNVLGQVKDVIQNTAQDIFEIRRPDGKDLLIPNVDEFVLKIDMQERHITVRLIDGMLDLQG